MVVLGVRGEIWYVAHSQLIIIHYMGVNIALLGKLGILDACQLSFSKPKSLKVISSSPSTLRLIIKQGFQTHTNVLDMINKSNCI